MHKTIMEKRKQNRKKYKMDSLEKTRDKTWTGGEASIVKKVNVIDGKFALE